MQELNNSDGLLRIMNTPDFKITAEGPVSKAFVSAGSSDFQSALLLVKQLPYKRNENKNDLLVVLRDGYGTCSTKHALLKQLANEQGFVGIELILGVFKMTSANTSSVAKTLEKYDLSYIPEAHNYLKYKDEIIDCTKASWKASDFTSDLMEELTIEPSQITDFKVRYHMLFLEKWLKENKHVPYNLRELWEIREQCIQDLSA